MKLVNLSESDNTKLEGYRNWKRRMIEVTQTLKSDTGAGNMSFSSFRSSPLFLEDSGSRQSG